MTRNREPKITNFHFSRMHGDKTVNLGKSVVDMINWMSPEKMLEHADKQGKSIVVPYTQKHEIFRLLLRNLFIYLTSDCD